MHTEILETKNLYTPNPEKNYELVLEASEHKWCVEYALKLLLVNKS